MKRFDQFWSVYPKKLAKAGAQKAWKKQRCEKAFDPIMDSLERFLSSDDWTKDNGKFIPHPATWLNGKRWEDELPLNGKERTIGLRPDEMPPVYVFKTP